MTEKRPVGRPVRPDPKIARTFRLEQVSIQRLADTAESTGLSQAEIIELLIDRLPDVANLGGDPEKAKNTLINVLR